MTTPANLSPASAEEFHVQAVYSELKRAILRLREHDLQLTDDHVAEALRRISEQY